MRFKPPFASLLGVAALACAGPALAKPLEPCRLAGIETQALCGKVKRPLDEANPSGKQIDVHFAVLPAIARNKLPDPVVMVSGGPGQSGIKLAPMAKQLFRRLNNRRDIVVFDQRGIGKSMDLSCKTSPRESLSGMDVAQLPARMQQCKAELKAKHGLAEGDFTHFTTEKASRDLDAIRQALGAEQINIVGGSYGTRAGLDYLRQFPKHVRRAVLDGMAPPDMVLPLTFETDPSVALDAVFRACEADKACNARYPKLAEALDSALAALPQPVELRHPVTLQRERIVLTRETLLSALRTPLYFPPLAQALPLAISQAAQGDYAPVIGLANALNAPGGELAWGMHFSVVCAEDFPRMANAASSAPTRFAGTGAKLYGEVCRNWPQAPVSEAFYSMPKASMPVLVMSGGADPVTPPRHGERAAQALGANARHIVAPQVGHGVMGAGCGRDVLYHFIYAADAAKALAVDAKCLERLPRPMAFTVPLPAGERP